MSALLTMAILSGNWEPLPPGTAKLLQAAPRPVLYTHAYVAGFFDSGLLILT